MVVKDDTGREIVAGDKLIWKDQSGERTGTVKADPKYEGGLRIGGRSVKDIYEQSDSMTVVVPVGR